MSKLFSFLQVTMASLKASTLWKSFKQKCRRIAAQSTSIQHDCYRILWDLTQNIEVREIEPGQTGAYIDALEQNIVSRPNKVKQLQSDIKKALQECGDVVASDSWTVLEATYLSTSFVKYNDKHSPSKHLRMQHIDVPHSVNAAIELVKKGLAYDEANDLKGAITLYSLAFHLTRLIAEEAEMSPAAKCMVLLSEYNIFRAICYLQPLNEAECMTEWRKFKTIENADNKTLKIPKMPKDRKSDEAQAIQRVLSNATIEKPKIPLSQVIGQQQAVDDIKEKLLNQLTQSGLSPVKSFGKAPRHRGFLLYGPPGNGKTLLAKATASEAKNMTFMSMDLSGIQSKWKGMTEATLNAFFKIAEMNSPTIVFIDEIEALLGNRSNLDTDSNNATVATMLQNCEQREGIFFFGATNKPWVIDEAFYRRLVPVYVKMPCKDDRFEFLRREFLGLTSLITTKHLDHIADITDGYSFDDLNNLIASIVTATAQKTSKSKFFKKTYNNFSDEDQFCACQKQDPEAIETTMDNLPPDSIKGLPICLSIALQCIMKSHKTVDSVSLQMFKKFSKDFSSVRREEEAKASKNKDNQFEFYKGFNDDVKMGKFNTTRRSLHFPSQKVFGKNTFSKEV